MSNQKLLDALKTKIENELVCKLKDEATNIVFGKGNSNADIVFIGEAPGKDEDKQGLPFVGRAGKELDKQLEQIGLKTKDVYICNILKYRPPKNRNPTKDEIQNHTSYLIEQLKIIKPKIIVTLGNYSTKFILGGFDVKNMKHVQGITDLHATFNKLKFENYLTTVIPMYHPAAMLYNPKIREQFEKDFIVMREFLNK